MSLFIGRAKRLDDLDLPRLGALIGVGEDEIHAFLDVESRGSGFDAHGRPKILFEPHVFYRNLAPGPKRDKAVNGGLACKKWGEIPYGKESAQYGKLELAMQIDVEAALKACSWGLTQVLGENHGICGYKTARDMVVAFADDEENHLKAAIDYILHNSLDDELREHRWAAFARGYNGPGYKKNNYDTELAKAYAKWRKIPDTPYPPIQNTPVLDAVPAEPKGKKPAPVSGTTAVLTGLVIAVTTLVTGAWEWLANLPCAYLNLFCGG